MARLKSVIGINRNDHPPTATVIEFEFHVRLNRRKRIDKKWKKRLGKRRGSAASVIKAQQAALEMCSKRISR